MKQEKTLGTRPLRVMELFAGVGGFRLGLNGARHPDGSPGYDVVWANQWEPGSRKQYAAEVYRSRWGGGDLVNRDIFQVLDDWVDTAHLDALSPEVLVGGFPCQDYSVAKPLSQSRGLEGKKGVLWWAIHRMLQDRIAAGSPVQYLLLENVDRLLSSPSGCCGRDFAVLLASLMSMGYAVEWRVVNAADYGFPQRRKRIFIQAYHAGSAVYRTLQKYLQQIGANLWLSQSGPMARALPVNQIARDILTMLTLPMDILEAQSGYTPLNDKTPFRNSGLCLEGKVWTADLKPAAIDDYTPYTGQVAPMTLGQVIAESTEVPERFFIDAASLPRWEFLKGGKSVPRTSNSGHQYNYKEGGMAFPDLPDRPSRTIITSEGGSSPSRTTHVVQHADGRLRRLTPEELEALNGFPRGYTDIPDITDTKRAFLMGNALVTGLVKRLGQALLDCHGRDN